MELAWIVLLIIQPLSLGEAIASFLLLPHLLLRAPSLYISPLSLPLGRVLASLRLNRFHYCCYYRPPLSTCVLPRHVSILIINEVDFFLKSVIDFLSLPRFWLPV